VRYGIQVIAWPQAALSPGGAGLTAEEISEFLRRIIHYVAFGRGNVLIFDGQQPTTVAPGKVSYTVYFRRLGGDGPLPKVMLPGIASEAILVDGIATSFRITLTCVPTGPLAYTPVIWYTLDGSLPTPGPATPYRAVSLRYEAPFIIDSPCLLRVTAWADGLQPSDAIEADVTPLLPS
jgi:hypothetical protein